ncbi:MAG: alpha/beta hydrolase [Bacteroidales bacterium]|nr:alpha/beta hydrolase [Bacteroidales bacterium]
MAISLGFFLISGLIGHAQKVESIYSELIPSGSKTLVISNREHFLQNGELQFTNQVKEGKELLFIEATFIDDDLLSEICEREAFFERVYQSNDDWLLFIHGDSKTYEQAVMRAFDIQYLYGINVMVFCWPSRDPELGGVKNFKNSRQNLMLSLDHFVELLCQIDQFRNRHPDFQDNRQLSLFIHSLGNLYLEKMIEEGLGPENTEKLFDNLIINAAAVNQDGHPSWVEKLNIQKSIYITSNKQDFNLKGVRIFTSDGKQLGEKVEHPLAANATYIQFTRAVGFRFPTGSTHTYFIGKMADKSMNIRRFYAALFHGMPVDINDQEVFSKNKKELGFDIKQ